MFARAGQPEQAASELKRAFFGFRSDPWIHTTLMARALDLAVELSRRNPRLGPELFAALEAPFAAHILEQSRKDVRLQISLATRNPSLCLLAFTAFEPWPPWREDFLRQRCSCYMVSEQPLAEEACEDLARFRADAPARFEEGLVP